MVFSAAYLAHVAHWHHQASNNYTKPHFEAVAFFFSGA